MLSVEESRLRGDLVSVYKCLVVRGVKEVEPESCQGCSGAGRKQWGQVELQAIAMKDGETLFYCEGNEQWHRLPREVVESLSLEMLRRCLIVVLSNLL